jgi:hypothetical protein
MAISEEVTCNTDDYYSSSYHGSDPAYDEDGENTLSGGDIGDEYQGFRSYLIERGFEKVGWGSFRATYQRGKIVIKVPRNSDGMVDNMVEARAWHKYKNSPTKDGVFLAPCRLLENGCLMMVAVDVQFFNHSDDAGAPDWMKQIEGWQIGLYRGKMVAYDFALDIDERVAWEEEWGLRSEYFNEYCRPSERICILKF